MGVTSTEFFSNIKKVPTLDSREYDSFFEKELEKIERGITVNGIYYPGWLYWHLNHWKMLLDYEDAYGKVRRKLGCGELRDNEWIIAEHFVRAEELKKGLLLVGSRRFAKTEIGASHIGYNSIRMYGSENLIAASNDPDINKINASLKRGYAHLDPYFKPLFLNDSWRAGEDVVLGYKDDSGERKEYSRLIIRNHNEGRKTEVGAGTTLSAALIDEIGKSDWLDFFDAIIPNMESEYGWRCSPIATGTTGNMNNARELEKVYRDMETHNFISIELKDDKGTHFSFFPGMMSLKCPKVEIPVTEYLKIPNKENKDTIKVTNWEKSLDLISKEIENLEANNKVSSARKQKMYYPRNEEEMFLTDTSDNPFSDLVPHAKAHMNYLLGLENRQEKYGWMTRDNTGKVIFEKTDKKPIQDYPTNEQDDKDAPIIIYHDPIPGAEFGILHVAGSDPYNQDESYYSPSLGTLYIFRRTYDPLRGVGQETFVASYSARTKNITKWRQQVRLLLEYYDAVCLPENEEPGFIRYFDEHHISHYLEDGLDLAKTINPNTKSNRAKGLNASIPNIRYGNGILAQWGLEEIIVGVDSNGENIVKMGITRCSDICLLKEIIEYKDKKEGIKGKKVNVDRIVAARHALILNQIRQKYSPVAKIKPVDQPVKERSKVSSGPFSMKHTKTVNKRAKGPFSTH